MGALAKSDAISRWSAEFVESSLEQAYRSYMQPLIARQLRVVLKVWAALLLTFGLLDLEALGWTTDFYILAACRVLQAIFLLSFSVILHRRPQLAPSGVMVTLLEIVGMLLFLPIYFLRPDIAVLIVVVVAGMLLSMFLFVPNRLKLTLLAAFICQALIMLAIAWKGAELDQIIGALFLTTLPIVVGFFAAQQLHTLQRRQFAMFREAERANQELRREMERRQVLEAELKRQATTDPLTGLLNRRQYEIIFHRERERCRRQGVSMCLAMADLDFFKKLNDELGHDAGDIALQHVAKLFKTQLRDGDVVGRFGGEEFIMLLPDTDIANAWCVIERLRVTLENTPAILNGVPRTITATFSVSEVWDHEKDIVETLRRVDGGLYAGKRAGRNRVMQV